MRKQLTIILCAIAFSLLFFTCKKEKLEYVTENPTEETEEIMETTIKMKSPFDGASQFVISHNYLMRMMNFALMNALVRPEMHGLQAPAQVDTRSCPMVTVSTDSSNVMVIDFGTGCYFNNTVGGTADFISGAITLEAFGSITDPSTNTFLFMDELNINGTTIRFVAGNPEAAGWVAKFTFIGNSQQNNFEFSGKVDGSITPNMGLDGTFDRSRFQIIDDVSGDSLVLYPTYSNASTNSFTFKYINTDNPNTPPEFTFSSLVNGLYEITISPIIGLYHDAAGNLVEDYNIRKGAEPLLFKPLCKWMYGGDLIYENISNNPNYTDTQPDPFMEIFYGSDENGDIENECDRYVKMRSCDGFLNGACVNEQIEIISCPL